MLVGSNSTVTVVDPPGAIVSAGAVETEKSPGEAPEKDTALGPSVNTPLPVLRIVKVRVVACPSRNAPRKPVWSVVEGVVSPSEISIPLPSTTISGPAISRLSLAAAAIIETPDVRSLVVFE